MNDAGALKPVSLTAFYTCGIRATDAAARRPVIGDAHAASLMTEDGWALARRMQGLRNPWNSVLARHWLMDRHIRAALQSDPDLRVVLLGAGLDTRAFRMPAGRWLEIDEPALIAFKEQRLPAASAPRPLERVAVDFARESLADVLRAHAEPGRALAIVEGVVMYLGQAQLEASFAALAGLAPRVELLLDQMSPVFFRRVGQSTHRRLAAFGAPFRVADQDVAGAFSAAGFREVRSHSIPLAMAELGIGPAPAWLLHSLLRWLRDGYQVVELERGG